MKALVAFAAVLAVAASAHAASKPHITVYAASSLTSVFPRIDPGERYAFDGSNALAAQIAQGAPADVFASANTKLPAQLHARHLCSAPVVFTRNALVLIVPRGNPAHIHRVADAAAHGVRLVIAAKGVPVGDYTRDVLAHLQTGRAVLANVVSEESDVREVLAKVALGEADAGFVYATDARSVPGKVTQVALPSSAQAKVKYGACVVSASHHQVAAQAFVARLLKTPAQIRLRAFGFLAR